MHGLTYPYNISLSRWAADLAFRFKRARIPVLTNEEKWQDWANAVVAIGVFRENAAPSASKVKGSSASDTYDNWETWAKAVYSVMIGVKND